MPLTQINFIPGINTENTPTGNEGRWIDGDNIRFRKGLPQKIGGWNKFSDEYFVGAVRGLFSYYDLDGSRYAIIPPTGITSPSLATILPKIPDPVASTS